MRNIAIAIIAVLGAGTASAQTEQTDSAVVQPQVEQEAVADSVAAEPEIQAAQSDTMSISAVMEACMAMRDAAATHDVDAIRRASSELRDCRTTPFNQLRCKDDSIASLSGHLVFDETFADSLASGVDVYSRADAMSHRRGPSRGQTADGSILTKTCFVKAKQSTKYTFSSRGLQELAVVAEAGGLVTMRIHVTNRAGLDVRYDDTKMVKRGMPQRSTSFNLPTDRLNTVELEIVNCGNTDCSFVVISN